MERIIARNVMNNRTYLVQEEPRGPSQLIEINVTANGLSDIPLPSVPNLRSDVEQTIIIKAMRIIPADVLVAGPLSGNATAPLGELQKISLSLYCEGWLKGQNIPVCTLIDTFVEGSGVPYRDRTMQFANWQSVIWEKTNLVFSNGTVSAGAPYTVLLEVEYVKLNGKFEEIVGPS